MKLSAILAEALIADGRLATTIPENWKQGRTTYGGFTSALALAAATSLADDLPPLRSAQISFVGPLAGAVEAKATLLRRGRTAAFVSVDVTADGMLGLRAMFVFVVGQDSKIAFDLGVAPTVPVPENAAIAMKQVDAPFFTNNFGYRHGLPRDQPPAPDLLRWVRLHEREGLDPMTELIAVADALPPAAFGVAGGFAPVSSMTWLVNLLTARPTTRDGWWLLRSTSDFAAGGSSSQIMSIWNTQGEPIASGMQSVAIFA